MINFFLGLAFNKWKNHLDFVVNSINRNKSNYKSKLNTLISFFSTPHTTVNLPQNNESFYKFKLKDVVRVDLNKTMRKSLGYKYSLHFGENPPPFPCYKGWLCFFIGKLAKKRGVIVSRRLTKTGRNTLTPFYGVRMEGNDQVCVTKNPVCAFLILPKYHLSPKKKPCLTCPLERAASPGGSEPNHVSVA